MEFNIYIVGILSVVFLIVGLFNLAPDESKYKLPVEESEIKKEKFHYFLSRVIPVKNKFLARIGVYNSFKNKLDAAHLSFTPVEFFNIKVLLVLFLFVASVIIFGQPKIWGVVASLFLGYVGPEVWLFQRIKKRKEDVARVLPETVDLLGLCVEAGLDFTMAVKWIVEKTTGNPMVEELQFVLEEIKWGKSRSQALKDMSKRLSISEVTSFVQAMVQAERMGTPVSEAFMIISEDTRMRRFQQGERFALKAPIKILVPLIFCILPVIGIIVGGPILLQFMQGDIFKATGF